MQIIMQRWIFRGFDSCVVYRSIDRLVFSYLIWKNNFQSIFFIVPTFVSLRRNAIYALSALTLSVRGNRVREIFLNSPWIDIKENVGSNTSTRREIKVLLSLGAKLSSFSLWFTVLPRTRGRRSSREIDSVREKVRDHRLPFSPTLFPNTFASPPLQLATGLSIISLRELRTTVPKFDKKSERKSGRFLIPIFFSKTVPPPPPSCIKSDRLFETVISVQRPGQKGFRRLFSIYSLFVPRGRGRGRGGTPPFSGSVVSASPSGVPEFHISRVEGGWNYHLIETT